MFYMTWKILNLNILTRWLTEPVSAVTDTDSLVVLVVIHTHPSLTQGGEAHSLTGPDLTEVPRVTPPTGTGKPIHSVHTGPSIHTGVTGTLIWKNTTKAEILILLTCTSMKPIHINGIIFIFIRIWITTSFLEICINSKSDSTADLY